MKYILISLALSTLLAFNTAASTFDKVVTIFNTSCAFSDCHDSENSAVGLDLSGDKAAIYDQIINVKPTNPVAAAKAHLLVKPGDPARSFLYRKLNYDLHNDSKLLEGELQNMPVGGSLEKHEIELVRQWILFGAKNDDVDYVNPNVLEEYYTIGGLEQIKAPEAPMPGKGYQIELGPIFLAPGEEVEYVYRYELQNEEPLEINKIDVEMNSQSHHFLFFKFEQGSETDQGDGLLPVGFVGEQAITQNTKMIGGWAYSREIKLPAKTAFRWRKNEVLKLNYHILNYSTSSILPAKLFVNVYTQPVGTAVKEMHSEFHLSVEEDFSVGSRFPPGVSNHEWNMKNFEEARDNETVHIWSLGSHTHKYGTDFDIYLNENGIQGEQVYEGDYNLDYTFNQGYYNSEEPAFRFFQDFLPVKVNEGLIIKGEYTNTSNQTVNVGLTTKDEMFGLFLNYLTGDIGELVGIEEQDDKIENNWDIYPNPTNGTLRVSLPELKEIFSINIYNAQGKLIFNEKLKPGLQYKTLDLSVYNSGFYFVQINNENYSAGKKVCLR